MDDKIIDAKFTDVDNESKTYSTIEEVSEMLSVDVPTIMFWCNKFNYILNIQSIGMYEIFNISDVENLKTIKRLVDEGKTISDIKLYFKQNKNAIIEKKEPQIPEVSLISILAKLLNTQNEKIDSLVKTNEKILNLNELLIKKHNDLETQISKSQEEICVDIDQQSKVILESQKKKMNELLDKDLSKTEEIKTLKDEITRLNETLADKIDNIEKQTTNRLNQSEETMKQHMQQRKQELLKDLEVKQNKSIWSKLFNKK